MRIVADENIPLLDELFASRAELIKVPGRGIDAALVACADVLLLRSVTRADASLLARSAVRFIGTATIGLDHLDTAYLEERGIAYANAPGCNAQAVVDYVLAAMAVWAQRQDRNLLEQKVGIVGLGNVGGELQRRLQALGVGCLANDPPLARQGRAGQVELEQLLVQADIISLHTPYKRQGPDATHHLFDASRLAALKPNALLINTGRGAVVENVALASLLQQRSDLSAVLDVWEHEPAIDPGLLSQVLLGTPHIAGYSLEGKIAGTLQIYRSFCRHFGLAPRDLTPLLPAPQALELAQSPAVASSLMQQCYNALLQAYDVRQDHQALLASLQSKEQLGAHFDRLRKNYPVRREFRACYLQGIDNPRLEQALLALGFSADRETACRRLMAL